MPLLFARRGIFFIVYLFFQGIMRGEPTYIIIAVALVLGIIGWSMYKSHVKSNESDVADYAQQFNKPPGDDPYQNR